MIRKRWGERTAAPAYFGMAGRFGPMAAPPGRRGALRMGDRAAAYACLAAWRRENPERRLVVLEDPFLPGGEWAHHLGGEWLFGEIADELLLATRPDEPLPQPEGEALYRRTLWAEWRGLRDRPRGPLPLRVPGDLLFRMAEVLSELGVGPGFLSIQPLFDARYDTFRNASPAWWAAVTQALAEFGPVVILGDKQNAGAFPAPAGAVPLWQHGLNPMESLAVIQLAALHVGGETGMSLWAAILGTPLFALYRDPRFGGQGRGPGDICDTRPLDFGRPVVIGALHDSPGAVGGQVAAMLAAARDTARRP